MALSHFNIISHDKTDQAKHKNTRQSTIPWLQGYIFRHPERRLIIRVSRQGLRSHYQQIDGSVQENKQRRCQINWISAEVPWEAAETSGNGDISTSQRWPGRSLEFQLERQTFLNSTQPADPMGLLSGTEYDK